MKKWRKIQLIDIDKELKGLKTEYKPDESLRLQTRSLIKSEIESRKGQKKTLKRAAFIFSPAVAVLLILVLCISVFTAEPAKAAGYYTIDINPSISLSVDENDIVISADPENEDASRLLETIDIKGLRFEEALKLVLQAAEDMDYIKENGHVLVAYFGDGQGIEQEELVSIVSGELPDVKISALYISGSSDDYITAKKSGKKAGIELLMKNAAETGVSGQDPDAVINILSGKAKNGNKEDKDKDKEDKENQINNGNQNNGDNKVNNPPGKDDQGNGGNPDGNGNKGNGGSNNDGKDKDKDTGKTKQEHSNKGKNN